MPVDFNERIPNHYEKIFLEAKEIQGPYTPIPFGLDGPFKDRSKSVPGKYIAVLAIDKKYSKSPIYLAGILVDRFPKKSDLIKPFYKSRYWTEITAKKSILLEIMQTKSSSSTTELKVMSYNTLSGHLGQLGAQDYWKHLLGQPEIELDYRQQILRAEVEHYKPDIIGYQEAEETAIPKSYEYVISRKLSFSNRMPLLVVAYNPSSVDLIEHETVDYQDRASPAQRQVLENTKHRYLAAKFRSKQGKEFYFLTTHLYFKSKTIRDVQFEILLEQARMFDCPVIITGDLNMNVRNEHPMLPGNSNENSPENFRLCDTDSDYTTILKSGFKSKLDWCLYKNCSQTGYLSTPSEDYVIDNGFMPSKMFPSDHFCQGFSIKF